MDTMSEELRWKRDQHDAKVESAKAVEAQNLRREITAKIGKAWTQRISALKLKFVRMAEKGPVPGVEVAKLLTKLNDEMEVLVRSNCGDPALMDFAEVTLALLAEKTEVLRITMMTDCNCLTPYVPGHAQPQKSVEMAQANQPVVARYSFKSVKEFRKLPPVRAVSKRDGFVGFVLNGLALWSIYEDGDSVPFGMVVNLIGLDKVPGKQDWQEALADHRKRK